MAAAINRAVQMQETDRSKWIREAIKARITTAGALPPESNSFQRSPQ